MRRSWLACRGQHDDRARWGRLERRRKRAEAAGLDGQRLALVRASHLQKEARCFVPPPRAARESEAVMPKEDGAKGGRSCQRRKEDGIKLIMSAEVFQQSGHQLIALPAARAQADTARPAPTRLQLVTL